MTRIRFTLDFVVQAKTNSAIPLEEFLQRIIDGSEDNPARDAMIESGVTHVEGGAVLQVSVLPHDRSRTCR